MKYNKTFKEALKQVREQDDKDHEISMARGELQAIADKALALNSALHGKSDEGNPLEAWVQSKITKAKDYINSVSDYLMYTPDMAKEDFDDINRQRGSKHVSTKDSGKEDIQSLKNQIQMLKIELENEKNKSVKPEPNPDTGEVPLRTGLAQAILDKSTPSPDLKSLDKKKLKMSLGKTKIEVNPDVEIGVFSGGKQTTSGNLH